jgi:hypothetical protein
MTARLVEDVELAPVPRRDGDLADLVRFVTKHCGRDAADVLTGGIEVGYVEAALPIECQAPRSPEPGAQGADPFPGASVGGEVSSDRGDDAVRSDSPNAMILRYIQASI